MREVKPIVSGLRSRRAITLSTLLDTTFAKDTAGVEVSAIVTASLGNRDGDGSRQKAPTAKNVEQGEF
jgi:hypothetical protein